MTEFERAVLEVLARFSEPLGWYQIEIRLSMMALSERPHLPTILARLRERGLIEESTWPSDPKVRHVIIAAGRAELEH